MDRKKAILNWSGGKDSAIALHNILMNEKLEIWSLVTTINKDQGRISMHGVRESLLDMQARSIGLPMRKVKLSEMPSMEEYNSQMKSMLQEFSTLGVTHSIFGDIFLEDLRKYRDERLAESGLIGLYPLWKMNTKNLIEKFVALGFKAVVVCVNAAYLDKSFLGRDLNQSFIDDLPENVDACWENGEFHTFVYDGPIFRNPIPFKNGKQVFKQYSKRSKSNKNFDTGFWYLDLLDH